MTLKSDRQSAANRLAAYALAAVFGERENRWPSALQGAIAAEIEAEMRKRERAAMERLLKSMGVLGIILGDGSSIDELLDREERP